MKYKPCPTPQKIKHKTSGAASKHRVSLKAANPDAQLNIYPCYCGYWHVGRPSLEYKIRWMKKPDRVKRRK